MSRTIRRLPSAALFVTLVALMGLSAGAATAAEKTPPGDPPGNNGTIKVVASDPSDPDPGNEPQVDGCLVWLEFYGFDQGQTARITFTAQPPTGDKELIPPHEATISEDPAGGGQDKDAVLSYNLTSAVAGLEAHPQQGYHIKVTSDSLQAPGGAKQKVFWLKCAPAAVTSLRVTKTVEGTGQGPFGFTLNCNHSPVDRTFTLEAGQSLDVTDIPGGTTCVATETDPRGASTQIAESSSDATADGTVKIEAGAPATITFTNRFPATAQVAGAEVAGVQATTPAAVAADQLPRTGGGAAALAAVGLWAVAIGALVIASGRRRRV